MLVLLVAQQPAPAQTPDYDFSAGYGYLPAGYGRLTSAQMPVPATPGPNPTTPNAGMSGATMPGAMPMPQYQGESSGGEFFGNTCAGVGWQVIGEYLYLRPSNAEVTYAQVYDNISGVSFPFGRTGVANPFYNPGFRVSAAAALGDCAAIGVSYTYYETTLDTTVFATDNPLGDAPPLSEVRSLLLFPGTIQTSSPADFATAHEMIRFHLADVDYKAALVSGPRYCANALIGVRYASLQQDFNSAISGGGAVDEVISNVRFEGGGLRAGLEGERQSASTGFLVYGKGTASFVAGTARGNYIQFNDTTDPNLVDTEFKTNRIITMLDFEVGAGWASEDGTIRVTGGWMVSAWYNTIKPSRLIESVRTSTPAVLDSPTENMLAFDGLVFRVEWRF
jgi:hypothetical protein